MSNTKFRVQIDFAYDEWTLDEAIARSQKDVEGLEIVDALTHGPSGWPMVWLVGTVEVIVKAIEKLYPTGDDGDDLDLLRAVLGDLEEV